MNPTVVKTEISPNGGVGLITDRIGGINLHGPQRMENRRGTFTVYYDTPSQFVQCMVCRRYPIIPEGGYANNICCSWECSLSHRTGRPVRLTQADKLMAERVALLSAGQGITVELEEGRRGSELKLTGMFYREFQQNVGQLGTQRDYRVGHNCNGAFIAGLAVPKAENEGLQLVEHLPPPPHLQQNQAANWNFHPQGRYVNRGPDP